MVGDLKLRNIFIGCYWTNLGGAATDGSPHGLVLFCKKYMNKFEYYTFHARAL